jgi:acetyltransferase-like isoleucine patch superfamily enzyme
VTYVARKPVQVLWNRLLKHVFSVVVHPIRTIRYWLDRCTRPVPFGLWLLNALCQRLLGINGEYPWMIHFTNRVTGNIEIGTHVWVSFAVSGGCYIQGANGIEIGDHTIFAPGVKIISANHDPNDLCRLLLGPPVRMGKRCWIGANAVILPGVQLGDDVIVGAGAVVTKSVPSGTVVAGVPAKPVSTQSTLYARRVRPSPNSSSQYTEG